MIEIFENIVNKNNKFIFNFNGMCMQFKEANCDSFFSSKRLNHKELQEKQIHNGKVVKPEIDEEN